MNHQTIGLTVFVNDQELTGDLEVDRNVQVVWSDGATCWTSWTRADVADLLTCIDFLIAHNGPRP